MEGTHCFFFLKKSKHLAIFSKVKYFLKHQLKHILYFSLICPYFIEVSGNFHESNLQSLIILGLKKI